jgi:hypothetical protein
MKGEKQCQNYQKYKGTTKTVKSKTRMTTKKKLPPKETTVMRAGIKKEYLKKQKCMQSHVQAAQGRCC